MKSARSAVSWTCPGTKRTHAPCTWVVYSVDHTHRGGDSETHAKYSSAETRERAWRARASRTRPCARMWRCSSTGDTPAEVYELTLSEQQARGHTHGHRSGASGRVHGHGRATRRARHRLPRACAPDRGRAAPPASSPRAPPHGLGLGLGLGWPPPPTGHAIEQLSGHARARAAESARGCRGGRPRPRPSSRGKAAA